MRNSNEGQGPVGPIAQTAKQDKQSLPALLCPSLNGQRYPAAQVVEQRVGPVCLSFAGLFTALILTIETPQRF